MAISLSPLPTLDSIKLVYNKILIIKQNKKTMKDQQEKNNIDLNIPVLPKKKKDEVVCPNCKQKVVPSNLMCPECYHYVGEGKTVYQPISDKTAKKVRLILSFILVGIFILLVATGVVQLKSCEASNSNSFIPYRLFSPLSNLILTGFLL